ncbi:MULTISPECIES: hypothetical protein [Streptomyces]|uniref:DUF3618 domain-containing protein n=2 Tax=Streptomyces TaxID=1883 RepID=A0ABU2RR89_9ACTN|nr:MULTISPECIES: hypothetical protein [unclassified Streptomyces]MBK3596001.1 hypothetical protein [Streptomyces sp. MBT51]MDT0431362.1 hypothetical protein [Streptomyces sp. DSM 41770]
MSDTAQSHDETPAPDDVKAQMQQKAEQVKDKAAQVVKEAQDRLPDAVTDNAGQAREQIARAAASVAGRIQERTPDAVADTAGRLARSANRRRGPLLAVAALVLLVLVGRRRSGKRR